MKPLKFNLETVDVRIIFVSFFILLSFISLLPAYIGSTDVSDYSNVAKYFAGKYSAEIRSSHSYVYGFMLSPLVRLVDSFILMKFMSVVWIFLIVLSAYYISGKDRRTLLLFIFSPIFWYMAPWINPIQISTLFFLWGYCFLREYNERGKLRLLSYAGLLFGVAWIFWDTILFLGIIFGFVFLCNRKVSHVLFFLLFVFIGLLPRLILDQMLFNFAFFTILKSFLGTLTNTLWGGVRGMGGQTSKTLINIISIFIMFPLYSFLILKKKYFLKNKKTIISLGLSLLLIIMNPQIRYTLILIPIVLLNLPSINKEKLRRGLIISGVISLLVISPYLLQIVYSTNSPELNSALKNFGKIEFSVVSPEELIIEDLKSITEEFPNQRFIVGNRDDDYSKLAGLYWENSVDEFVSIEDYRYFLENSSLIFEKKFAPIPTIRSRRLIWIVGGISANLDSPEKYSSIEYALSLENTLDIQNFSKVKSYSKLTLFKKDS
jgi:hypothetical protein